MLKLEKIVASPTPIIDHFDIEGTLSNLRQFLAIESPLKMMKNASYFTLKAL